MVMQVSLCNRRSTTTSRKKGKIILYSFWSKIKIILCFAIESYLREWENDR